MTMESPWWNCVEADMKEVAESHVGLEDTIRRAREGDAKLLQAAMEDNRTLVARIRALAAQAALDGAIIDMVDGLVSPFAWTDAMDGDGEYSFSFGEAMVKAVKDGRALALENALAERSAALKAREGEMLQ